MTGGAATGRPPDYCRDKRWSLVVDDDGVERFVADIDGTYSCKQRFQRTGATDAGAGFTGSSLQHVRMAVQPIEDLLPQIETMLATALVPVGELREVVHQAHTAIRELPESAVAHIDKFRKQAAEARQAQELAEKRADAAEEAATIARAEATEANQALQVAVDAQAAAVRDRDAKVKEAHAETRQFAAEAAAADARMLVAQNEAIKATAAAAAAEQRATEATTEAQQLRLAAAIADARADAAEQRATEAEQRTQEAEAARDAALIAETSARESAAGYRARLEDTTADLDTVTGERDTAQARLTAFFDALATVENAIPVTAPGTDAHQRATGQREVIAAIRDIFTNSEGTT